MIYKIVVDKQPMTNPSEEKREYEIDIDELHFKRDVYDSLVITHDEDYVIRRLELNEYNVLTELDPPIKEPLEDVNIELFEGENYIYLYDMTGNRIVAQYLVKNEFNQLYVTQSEMNSAIKQSAKAIELSVNGKFKDVNGDIKDLNANLELKVDKNDNDQVVSMINASSDEMIIHADKLDINGKAVNFKTNINDTKGPYTQTDLTRVQKIIMNIIIPTTEDYEKYDINGDRRISSEDITLIMKAIKENNGYIAGTGTFEINPYTMKRALALYNDSLNDYSALISLYGAYFNKLSTEYGLDIGEKTRLTSNNFDFQDDNGALELYLSGTFNGIKGQSLFMHSGFGIPNSSITIETYESGLSIYNNSRAVIDLNASGGGQTIITNEYISSPIFQVTGAGYCMNGTTTGHIYKCNWDGSSLHFYVDKTDIGNISDKRLKTDIKDVDEDLIKAIGELDYKQFKKDNRNGLISVGVIAQDLIEVLKKYNKNAKDYELLQEFEYNLDEKTLYYKIDYEQFLLLRMMAKEQEIKELQEKDKQKDTIISDLISRLEKLEKEANNGQD